MFLFSSPDSSVERTSSLTAGVDTVKSAIKKASDATGAGFAYLLRTAERESSLNPTAKAPTSSARGLYQFVDQTWLAMVKDEGAKFGLADKAAQITRGSDGKLNIADPQARKDILALRDDPQVSAMMAGAFTNRNAADLRTTLGRDPTEGELYMAHFLGAQGAGKLITMARDNPGANAARAFPEAADANRRIFFERSGEARSAGDVYRTLAQGQSGAAVPVQVASAVSPANVNSAVADRWVPFAAPKTNGARPFQSMFTDTTTNDVANAAQTAWGGRNLTSSARGAAAPAAVPMGGPFLSMNSPGWVRPVRGASGVGQPLDLTSFTIATMARQ